MKNKKVVILSFIFVSLFLNSFVHCEVVNATNNKKEKNYNIPLTRGQAIHVIIDSFDLNHTKKTYLEECRQSPDECFFVFSAMSPHPSH